MPLSKAKNRERMRKARKSVQPTCNLKEKYELGKKIIEEIESKYKPPVPKWLGF